MRYSNETLDKFIKAYGEGRVENFADQHFDGDIYQAAEYLYDQI